MLTRELADMISFILLIELFIISILLCIMGKYFITNEIVSRNILVTLYKKKLYLIDKYSFHRISVYDSAEI